MLATSRADFLRLVLAGTGAWAVAYLSYYAQTLMMSALMEKFDQGEAAVGLLSSLENGAFFSVMMLAAGPVARISRAKAAMLGALMLVVAVTRVSVARSWRFARRQRSRIAGSTSSRHGSTP